jgi:hypothetical protein
MNRSITGWLWLAALVSAFACSESAAQEEQATPPAAEQAKTKQAVPSLKSPYRPLAPGVMITIDPMRELKETIDRHDVVELLAVDSKFDWAKDITFRRDVWVLDFKFKPVRMIRVDIPQPSGYMQQKLIWYMVYSVTNTGKVLHPVEDVELTYETAEKKLLYRVDDTVDQPIRFVPEFLFEACVRRPDKSVLTKVYPDRVMPLAMAAIRMREDPNRQFLSSVEMCRNLAVGETQWGIATWEDVDPKTFRFSVYVVGLTNAYRWTDEKGAVKPNDPIGKGRKLYRKTLKLNFWRPGDPFFEREDEIRYGLPEEFLPKDREGRPIIPKGLDYEWVYR